MADVKNDQLTANFYLHEFYCNDKENTPVPDKYLDNVKELAKNLQVIRDYLGDTLHVNSGYRTPAYQKIVNPKVKNSQHCIGKAADTVTRNKTPRQLHAIIEKLIAEGKIKNGGLGLYNGFCHYDIGPAGRRWDETTDETSA